MAGQAAFEFVLAKTQMVANPMAASANDAAISKSDECKKLNLQWNPLLEDIAAQTNKPDMPDDTLKEPQLPAEVAVEEKDAANSHSLWGSLLVGTPHPSTPKSDKLRNLRSPKVKALEDQPPAEPPAKKTKKSFANRTAPKTAEAFMKWNAMKLAFEAAPVKLMALQEPSFYMYCQEKWKDCSYDEDMYKQTARTFCRQWLEENNITSKK